MQLGTIAIYILYLGCRRVSAFFIMAYFKICSNRLTGHTSGEFALNDFPTIIGVTYRKMRMTLSVRIPKVPQVASRAIRCH